MSIDETTLDALLRSDAEHRAARAADDAPSDQPATVAPAAQALRVRLMGGWPREARPAFDAIGRTLGRFGYTLSPLHPATVRVSGSGLSRRAMQTQLTFANAEGGAFAPLMFALDEVNAQIHIFVQQSGGRAAADFPERSVGAMKTVDPDWLADLLREYVACMIRPRVLAAVG